jgi:hypothetical protein
MSKTPVEEVLKKALAYILDSDTLKSECVEADYSNQRVVYSPSKVFDIVISTYGSVEFRVRYHFTETEQRVWKAMPKALVQHVLDAYGIELKYKSQDGFDVEPTNAIFMGNLRKAAGELYKKVGKLRDEFVKEFVEERIHAWMISKGLKGE